MHSCYSDKKQTYTRTPSPIDIFTDVPPNSQAGPPPWPPNQHNGTNTHSLSHMPLHRHTHTHSCTCVQRLAFIRAQSRLNQRQRHSGILTSLDPKAFAKQEDGLSQTLMPRLPHPAEWHPCRHAFGLCRDGPLDGAVRPSERPESVTRYSCADCGSPGPTRRPESVMTHFW